MMISCHIHLYFHPDTGWTTASIESYQFHPELDAGSQERMHHRKQIEIPVYDDLSAQVKGLMSEGIDRWTRLVRKSANPL